MSMHLNFLSEARLVVLLVLLLVLWLPMTDAVGCVVLRSISRVASRPCVWIGTTRTLPKSRSRLEGREVSGDGL